MPNFCRKYWRGANNPTGLSETKAARTARKQQQIEENQFFEDSEGLLYGLGIAD